MIDYMRHERLDTIIYKNQRKEVKNKSMQHVIHMMCMDYLFSYEGYKEAVKRKFKIYYKIPLYIDDHIQLIPTERVKNYENIWINYAAIHHIRFDEEITHITFYSGQNLCIKLHKRIFEKQIARLEQIRMHLGKHFHA